MTTCLRCGAENPDGFRFCGSCGAPLGAAPAPAREERKVVTVLFADLVGFTSRAEQLDPEDVRELLAMYHARLRAELERHGGTVEKFIGDAVMALFGAPTAHEDDPERAVRAAFAIRDSIAEVDEREGRELHVRIGITTGEALVSLGARPETGEGMAAGDVVNTAARLQAAAPVDGVLVDERTFRAVERTIVLREAEPVAAKGKERPVRAWEALEARARLGVDVTREAGTPLVGRDQEVDLLRDALARTRRERAPQLVTLIGVPGIGKSRLVHELLRAVEEDPELIFWRQGRSLPYGEGVSFWALGEMVKAQAGILETDADDEAEAKLAHSVTDLVPEGDEARRVQRHLRPLVGLGRDDRSDAGREEAFAAWRRFLEALAERNPTVLVFEDLHWADDGLLDFVEHLVEWATEVPLLVLATARPELLSRRPGWGGGKPNATTLSIAPLSDEETARLLALLLDRAVMPAETQAELLSRAGGNPLYAEEFARMTAEDGERGTGLPETVHGIIAARLDGLGSDEKALLQDAAALGKVFWLGAVATIGERDRREVERLLHELERRQLVRRERRSSVAAETQYAFGHGLVRDVAYAQIPRARRAEKHRLAAEWITSLGTDRLEDRAELLAYHYLAAVELVRAAGGDEPELAERARVAVSAAGDRAVSLHAYAAAVRFYREALELVPEYHPERPALLLALGRALHVSGLLGEAELVAARDGLLEAGDLEGAAEAERALAEVAWHAGSPPRSLEHLERAARLLEGRPLTPAKAWVLGALARSLMLSGRSRDAVVLGRQALAAADALGLEELRAFALIVVGTAGSTVGERDAERNLERSIELAESIGSAEAVRGYINLASILAGRGEMRRSRAVHERGVEAAQRYGHVWRIRFLEAELAYDAYYLGDWEEARERTDAFLARVEAGSPHYMDGMTRMIRGAMRIARDDVDGALADMASSLEHARAAGEPQALLPALSFRAVVDLDVGRDPTAALDELVAALDDEEARRELWAVPAVFAFEAVGRGDEFVGLVGAEEAGSHWVTAALAYARGDYERAADLLAEIGTLPDEARARVRAAEALAVAGRRVEADVQLARATAFYREVGATRHLRRAERALAASA